MTHVSPVVTDTTRAIARLEEGPTADWSLLDLREAVAGKLAYHFQRANLTAAPGYVTVRTVPTVRVALAAHGATAETIETHARSIARMIRRILENH